MVNTDFLLPLWGCGHLPNNKSHEEFDLQKPPPVDLSDIGNQDLSESMDLIEKKQFTDAIDILEPLAAHNDTAKRLLLEALKSSSDFAGIISHFIEPVAPEEIIAVIDALWEDCLLYTSPSPRDRTRSRMPSSA